MKPHLHGGGPRDAQSPPADLPAARGLHARPPRPTTPPPARRNPRRCPRCPRSRVSQPPPRPGPKRSNADIARDFLDLSFRLESGRELAVFNPLRRADHRARHRPPARNHDARPRCAHPPPARRGRDRHLAHQRGAGQHHHRGPDPPRDPPQPAPRGLFSWCRASPTFPNTAALAAAPGPTGHSCATARNWRSSCPADASPQELRDCLHEELAQAIGPLNDLYRLPDSVFNDDNIHAVLTGFRHADPARLLRARTRQRHVAPRGRGAPARNPRPAQPRRCGHPRARARPHAAKLDQRHRGGPSAPTAAQANANAPRAAPSASAQSLGWQDHRRAFVHYAMGRLIAATDPDAAMGHFQAADRFFAATPGAGLHRAFVASQLAAHALSRGDGRTALALIEPNIPVAVPLRERRAPLDADAAARRGARNHRPRAPRAGPGASGQSGLGTLRIRRGLGRARPSCARSARSTRSKGNADKRAHHMIVLIGAALGVAFGIYQAKRRGGHRAPTWPSMARPTASPSPSWR